MSERARRRREARERAAARTPWLRAVDPPAGTVTVREFIAAADAGRPLTGCMVAAFPVAGHPSDAVQLDRISHDEVIRMVDESGGTRLGPVSWERVPASRTLAFLDERPLDPESDAALRRHLAEHPSHILVIAVVVAVPPGGDSPGADSTGTPDPGEESNP